MQKSPEIKAVMLIKHNSKEDMNKLNTVGSGDRGLLMELTPETEVQTLTPYDFE